MRLQARLPLKSAWVCAGALWAVTPAFSGPLASDGPAKAWLQEMAQPLQTAPYLEMRFGVTAYLPESDEPQRYEGQLKTSDSSRFRLELPMGTYVSDGVTFWEYHASTRQVIVKSAQALAGKALPARMLLDFLEAPALACDTVRGPEARKLAGSAKSKAVVRIALQPTENTGELDSLQVTIDLKSRKWLGVQTVDVQGGRTLYALHQLKPGKRASEGTFQFVPPAQSEVVDMR